MEAFLLTAIAAGADTPAKATAVLCGYLGRLARGGSGGGGSGVGRLEAPPGAAEAPSPPGYPSGVGLREARRGAPASRLVVQELVTRCGADLGPCLLEAAATGQAANCKLLLDLDAAKNNGPPQAPGSNAESARLFGPALVLAVGKDSVEVASLLLSRRADVRALDRPLALLQGLSGEKGARGALAARLLKTGGAADANGALDMAESAEMVRLLMGHGAEL